MAVILPYQVHGLTLVRLAQLVVRPKFVSARFAASRPTFVHSMRIARPDPLVAALIARTKWREGQLAVPRRDLCPRTHNLCAVSREFSDVRGNDPSR